MSFINSLASINSFDGMSTSIEHMKNDEEMVVVKDTSNITFTNNLGCKYKWSKWGNCIDNKQERNAIILDRPSNIEDCRIKNDVRPCGEDALLTFDIASLVQKDKMDRYRKKIIEFRDEKVVDILTRPQLRKDLLRTLEIVDNGNNLVAQGTLNSIAKMLKQVDDINHKRIMVLENDLKQIKEKLN